MSRQACTRCTSASLAFAALIGALFGVGLVVAGMTEPARVIAFLDPVSGWDPSLAFVMVGAVTVYAIAFRQIRRWRKDPWFDVRFHVPTHQTIDQRLLFGAAIFGIGWGLVGLCPGPAIVAAGGGSASAIMFVLAMLAGMRLVRRAN